MPLYAICPFFLYEKAKMIGCELKPLRFAENDLKKQWMENRCCSFDYKYCAHAQKLFSLYELKRL